MEILIAAFLITIGGLANFASIVMSRKRNVFLFCGSAVVYIVAVFALADFLLRTTQHTFGGSIATAVVMVATVFLTTIVIAIALFSLFGKPPNDHP